MNEETFVSVEVTRATSDEQEEIKRRLAEGKRKGLRAYYIPEPYDRVIVTPVPLLGFPTKIDLDLGEPQWNHLN